MAHHGVPNRPEILRELKARPENLKSSNTDDFSTPIIAEIC